MLVLSVDLFESLYKQVVSDETHIEDIDFLGLDIDPNNEKLEFKVYYPAKPPNRTDYQGKLFQSYSLAKEMIRCRCDVVCSSGHRMYYSLKNRTDQNIELLIQSLSERFPHIEKQRQEILNISRMHVTSVPFSTYASLHMIGHKEHDCIDDVIGIEWILRTMPNPNDPGYSYSYNDKYFYRYIDNLQNPYFCELLSKLSKLKVFVSKIEKRALHLWLAAIDFFPNGYKSIKYM